MNFSEKTAFARPTSFPLLVFHLLRLLSLGILRMQMFSWGVRLKTVLLPDRLTNGNHMNWIYSKNVWCIIGFYLLSLPSSLSLSLSHYLSLTSSQSLRHSAIHLSIYVFLYITVYLNRLYVCAVRFICNVCLHWSIKLTSLLYLILPDFCLATCLINSIVVVVVVVVVVAVLVLVLVLLLASLQTKCKFHEMLFCVGVAVLDGWGAECWRWQ